MSRAPYRPIFKNGKQLPIGEQLYGSGDSLLHKGQMPLQHDVPIDRPERACARCRNKFQPTKKRRLLCYACFTNDTRFATEGVEP